MRPRRPCVAGRGFRSGHQRRGTSDAGSQQAAAGLIDVRLMHKRFIGAGPGPGCPLFEAPVAHFWGPVEQRREA